MAPKLNTVRNSNPTPLKNCCGSLWRGQPGLCIRVLLPVAIAERVVGKEDVVGLPRAVKVVLQMRGTGGTVRWRDLAWARPPCWVRQHAAGSRQLSAPDA